ncbi:MAG: efflux RND transporter periplasmic adaptor subunit [Candidatus Sericytochromatia bacterium]
MRTWLIPLLLLTLLTAPGCKQGADHGHDHAHGEGGHDHGPEPRALTVFTDKTELFAEHPPLVVGEAVRLAVHLTDLRDWSPVSEGQLEVVLKSPGGQETVFQAPATASPGLFRPAITPQAAGEYALIFRLTAPTLQDTIAAGLVTVHADEDAAASGQAPEEAPEAIAFLKEQQWKIPFMTAPVAAASLEEGVALQGEVRPAAGREVVVTAPAAGRLAVGHGALPMIGQAVRRGQLLAVLTPVEPVEQDRASLKEALKRAETALSQARIERERAERLYAAQAAPAKRVEEARAAEVVAKAQLEAARDHLKAKEATLAGQAVVTEESYQLIAPIGGTVIESHAVPGAAVGAGSPLYRLVDLTTVWVEAHAHETDLNRVAKAARAEIAVPGAEAVTVGKGRGGLVAVGSALDPANRTAPVVYAVPNPEGHFRVGMSATVTALTGATPKGPVVPKSAVVDDNGRPVAYIQTGGETFERRPLTLGVREGDRVQVLSGLRPGERVVTQGGYEIRLTTLSDAVPAHGHAH